jgi:hypothetical protein
MLISLSLINTLKIFIFKLVNKLIKIIIKNFLIKI